MYYQKNFISFVFYVLFGFFSLNAASPENRCAGITFVKNSKRVAVSDTQSTNTADATSSAVAEVDKLSTLPTYNEAVYQNSASAAAAAACSSEAEIDEEIDPNRLYKSVLTVLAPALYDLLKNRAILHDSRLAPDQCLNDQLNAIVDMHFPSIALEQIASQQAFGGNEEYIKRSFVAILKAVLEEDSYAMRADVLENDDINIDIPLDGLEADGGFGDIVTSSLQSGFYLSFPAICTDSEGNFYEVCTPRRIASHENQGRQNNRENIFLQLSPIVKKTITNDSKLKLKVLASCSMLRKRIIGILDLYNDSKRMHSGQFSQHPHFGSLSMIMEMAEYVLLNLSRNLPRSTQLKHSIPYDYNEAQSLGQRQPLEVLIGPPGTGKTKVIVEGLQNANEQSIVVTVASGYKPLENILVRIPDRSRSVLMHSTRYDQAKSPCSDCLLSKERLDISLPLTRHKLSMPHKFTTPYNVRSLFLCMDKFVPEGGAPTDMKIILEEASKLTNVDFLVILRDLFELYEKLSAHQLLKPPHIQCVGDDHQLPPFSHTGNVSSIPILSLFANHPEVRPRILDVCHRFGEPAVGMIRKVFYNNYSIKSSDPDQYTGVQWHKVDECNPTEINDIEAQYILERLQPGDAVISPYNAQVDFIRQLATQRGVVGVTFSTIDSAQGNQYQRVWLSLVAANRKFVNDPYRLNVAASRMQDELHIVSSVDPNTESTVGKLCAEIKASSLKSPSKVNKKRGLDAEALPFVPGASSLLTKPAQPLVQTSSANLAERSSYMPYYKRSPELGAGIQLYQQQTLGTCVTTRGQSERTFKLREAMESVKTELVMQTQPAFTSTIEAQAVSQTQKTVAPMQRVVLPANRGRRT